ncbi:hypothetical protein PAERUG_P45_London_17_VIM_2_12_12_02934 [Pseudomonas aeruginosa]|nr:hypothetical protein PAERUG_P45_London_17_VIM_2_12_12_02934 [Pseudomonas aeruginosa]
MPVDILVQQVAEAPRAARIAGLRAEGAQPHEVAGLHLDPVLVQAVHRLAFQHVQAVLHHVGLGEGDHAARLEVDDVDVHVVAHVAHVDEAGGAPAAFGVRHHQRLDVLLVGDEGFRQRYAVDLLVVLADPVEAGVLAGGIAHLVVGARRNEGVAARLHGVDLALQGQAQLALDDEQHGLGVGILLRFVAATVGRQFDDVLREGLGEAGQRAGDHPHAHVVPERQVAGDDIAHHPLGNHGIGFGEHRPVGEQLGLCRVPAVRRVVAGLGHGAFPRCCLAAGSRAAGAKRAGASRC